MSERTEADRRRPTPRGGGYDRAAPTLRKGPLIANVDSSRARADLGERVRLGDSPFTTRFESAASISEDDVTTAIEVFRRAFNGGPSWFFLGVDPADHLRWKVGTAAGRAVLEVAEEGDAVVGAKLSFRQRYRFRGDDVTVEVGTDSAVDPEHQGRGINKLMATLRAGVIPLEPAAFCIDQKTHPFFKGLKAHPLGNEIDALVKPLSLRRLWAARSARGGADGPSHTRTTILAGSRAARVESVRKKLSFAARLGISRLRRTPVRAETETWTIQTTNRFDERADAFWEQTSTQFDLIQVRDRGWLNWRYCDPRGGPFTVRTAEEDGVLLGYSAFRITEAEAVIADLLTLPGRDDVAASLIDDAVEAAGKARVSRVRCWMARRHPYRAALQQAGFVPYDLPAPMVFEIRTFSPSEMELLSQPTARVHFMTADTDHI